MTRAEILRWPAKNDNDLVPWFVILWRSLWAPLVYGGMAIAWVGWLMVYGYAEACAFWKGAM
jgi:hypothetical protein